MKKWMAALLAAVLLISLAAADGLDLSNMTDTELKELKEEIDAELLKRSCAAEDSPTEDDMITGAWYLSEATANGQRVEVSNTGMAASIVIGPDGTYSFEINGMKTSGLWRRDGDRYYIAGDEVVEDDGRLIITTNDLRMVFAREPVDTEIPRTVAASGETDFLGEWVLDKVGQKGVVVPADIAPEGIGTDISMSIKQGTASVEWGSAGLSAGFDTSFADGRLTLSSGEQEKTGISFSPLEKTADDEIVTTMSMESGTEPVAIYLKRNPLYTEKEPIPSFGLKPGMSREQIISAMEKHGLVLFEEKYEENDLIAEGYFAFYGKAEVFGREVTTVKVTMSSRSVDYAFYFFDEQAEYRSRLPVSDARWYRTDELKAVFNHLYESLKERFGEPGAQYDWPVWKIKGKYYSLPEYSEADHMVIFSIFD